jgi:DNA polymerase I-like protein with 3'-5' exonuclease and polymerase domains
MNQIGAATGRTSSSAPNLQNIPHGSEYRLCFKSRPGYKLVTVDMSGAELRIMAELSGEPSWVDAFNNGWDVHSIGAEMMYGERWKQAALESCKFVSGRQKCKCPGHELLRNSVKAINF